MTEEFEALEGDLEAETALQDDPEAPLELIQDTLENFLAAADVETVYKEPIEHGDVLIIPTAEVVAFMGFGVMHGENNTEGENQGRGSGTGGGGVGKVFARPVATVVASPEGVRIEPVIDLTKIALAGLTTAAFMFGMLARINKMTKRFET